MCVKCFFLLAAVQKLFKSTVFFQGYDHKCTATFLRFTVFTAIIDDVVKLGSKTADSVAQMLTTTLTRVFTYYTDKTMTQQFA